MSPAEIATALDYEESSVKLVLASASTVYRQRHAKGSAEETFSVNEYDLARRTMSELLETAENEAVKYRCAKYIIDETKGRNNINPLAGVQVNINVLNETVKRAREAIQLAKDGARPAVIQEAIEV